MPRFRRGTPEDAPNRGPGSEPRADNAQLRTQTLTLELLDWCTAALEAVLATPQVRDSQQKRPPQALRTALKQLDYLYPETLRDRDRTPRQGLAPHGEEPDRDDGTPDHDWLLAPAPE